MSTEPSSDAPSLRFNVNQVKLDLPEENADEGRDSSPRMTFPDSETPNRPLSSLDATNTIGYATHDAVPMTVFYRNDNSQSNTAKKSRPTLKELRKGFEEDHEQQVIYIQPISCVLFHHQSCDNLYLVERKLEALYHRHALGFFWLYS